MRWWLIALLCSGCGDLSPEEGEELPGGATTNVILGGSNAYTAPMPNLVEAHSLDFFSGNSFFNQSWVVAPASTESRDGLGPLFNARSCSACHFKDGRGRPSGADEPDALGLLLRISRPGPDAHGGVRPDEVYGDQLQDIAIPNVPAEGRIAISYQEMPGVYDDGEPFSLRRPSYEIVEPAYGPLPADLQISPRVAPVTAGLGLLQEIPEADIRARADAGDADGDGISGRAQEVWDGVSNSYRLGRFGWKAEQPSIRGQTAGAFLGDIGITSSLHAQQNCSPSQAECNAAFTHAGPEIADALLDRVVLYGRTLAIPARAQFGAQEILRGKALFAAVGCAACHVPRWRTGPVGDLPELSGHDIWPYTDLLLHDLGPGLDDERPTFAASGSEWRTPPLWGLSHLQTVNRHQLLLHDGRARGIAEAILWHGGEAAGARARFVGLTAVERQALLRFVGSL
jgi:CxxC motif-containing protein (DUF1111 family)